MKMKIRIIALVALLAVLASVIGCGIANRRPPKESTPPVSIGAFSMDTFMGLLEKGISAGTSAGVKDALQPLVSALGSEILGLPENTSLYEIKEQLDVIDAKLDDIREEVAEGIDKVLSEIDKNNKMKNAVDSLARAEYLADQILNSNLDENAVTIESLNGAEQQRLVEINASIVSTKNVDELLDVLGVAKEYLTSGYIDTNYENAFKIYYDYMKKQSMFCGEAADLSEGYWTVMIESYAKSSVALLLALEQQASMYALADAKPENGITQEAIDAAKAVDFGSLNVIQKRIEDTKEDAGSVLSCYQTFVSNAEAEATVFINKGNCRIRLNAEPGIIDLGNLDDYQTYTAAADFASDGITEELYRSTLDRYSNYFYNNSYSHIDLSSVSYENFILNQGSCDLYKTYSDVNGSYDKHSVADWSTHSRNIFTNVMLNLKAVQYNSASKFSYDNLLLLMDHIQTNHATKSIGEYLTSVGFCFDGCDLEQEELFYILTADLNPGNRIDRVESDGRMYDIAALDKKYCAFDDVVDTASPKGKLVYLLHSDKSIRITIDSDGMDNRIYKGIYTVEAKEIVDYKSDGTPEYLPYEKVYEVKGTTVMYIDLPTDIDFSTIQITLGYDGLGASDNHEAVCQYDFSEYVGVGSEITLKMEGYTKWWGGYGVDAEILCDGNSLANGVG